MHCYVRDVTGWSHLQPMELVTEMMCRLAKRRVLPCSPVIACLATSATRLAAIGPLA